MTFPTSARSIVLRAVLVLIASGFALVPSTPAPPRGPVRTAQVQPPQADQPTAGICGTAVGAVAVVWINPDVPSPRCQRVTHDQRLKIVNNTGGPARVRIGAVDATVAPHDEQLVDQPLGAYLAPGVHRLPVTTYGGGGPELFFQR
jgi:hypothetical protein